MKLLKITNYKTLYESVATTFIPTHNIKYVEVVNKDLCIWFERPKQETTSSPFYPENEPMLSRNVDYIIFEFKTHREALMVVESFQDNASSAAERKQQRIDMPAPCDLALEELK